MTEANWYVVHTYSGYENKVKLLTKQSKTDILRTRSLQCVFRLRTSQR